MELRPKQEGAYAKRDVTVGKVTMRPAPQIPVMLSWLMLIVVAATGAAPDGSRQDGRPAMQRAMDRALPECVRIRAANSLSEAEFGSLEDRLVATLPANLDAVWVLGGVGDERALKALEAMEQRPEVPASVRPKIRWEIAKIRFRVAAFEAAASEHLRLGDRLAALSELTAVWQSRLESRLFAEIEGGGPDALSLLAVIGSETTAGKLQVLMDRITDGLMRTAIMRTIAEIRQGTSIVDDPGVSIYERIAASRKLDDKERADARRKVADFLLSGAACENEALGAVQMLGEVGDVDTIRELEKIDWIDDLAPRSARKFRAAVANALARIRERLAAR